jgi:hypothetical protein
VVEERRRLLPRLETFLDSDGDGCGDFAGLTERLDYLAGLGVTCLWLMPFYPSRQRDDGYDITDFYGIDGRPETAGDFAEMIRTPGNRPDTGSAATTRRALKRSPDEGAIQPPAPKECHRTEPR